MPITYRVGVDIGGTFTDIVLLGSDGAIHTKKVSSSVENYAQAIVEGLAEVCRESGMTGADIEEIRHGTTVASNAILEHKGARVGMITTKGFRDVLEIRTLRMPKLYDMSWTKPAPLVSVTCARSSTSGSITAATVPRPLGQAEQLGGPGRTEPLEVNGQFEAIEVLAYRGLGRGVGRQPRGGHLHSRNRLSLREPRPAILGPGDLLDCGLAAERAAPPVRQRPAAEVHEVGLAVLRVHEVGVPGALQLGVGAVPGRQKRPVRVELVGAHEIARPRDGRRMCPPGAAFRGEQEVKAVALVHVGSLGQSKRRALEDELPRANQTARRGIVLLDDNAGEAVVPRAMVPEHVQDVEPPVVVLEQGWVEPAAVEEHGVRPLAVDPWRGHEVVVHIPKRRARTATGPRGTAIALHVGVDEVEQAVHEA